MKRFAVVLLRRARLLGLARRVRDRLDPAVRGRLRQEWSELEEIRRTAPEILAPPPAPGTPGRRVLLFGMDTVAGIAVESTLRNAFRRAGYRPTVIAPPGRLIREAYRAFGEWDLRSLEDYWRDAARAPTLAMLAGAATTEDVLAIARDGVQVGKYAVASVMRRTRLGQLDLRDPRAWKELEAAFLYSIESTTAARRLLDELSPAAIVFVDRGYSPAGQVFDAALARDIPVYTWNAAHRDNTLMLKRYTAANRDVHPSALSEASWEKVREMEWSDAHAGRVLEELRECYRSGEWYGEVGTQVGKREVGRRDLTARLGLDPEKKTAVIFPHIFWDSTFFWGTDLFANYQDWFVELVRAACANSALNWVIKIHPANVTKDRRDGVSGEHAEVATIRRVFGELPAHIRILTADTDISTFSLFQLMDYCLTVRGTVGIEAACFGIPVLTSGTGRYEGLGFTIDSGSREEYLGRIASLGSVPELSHEQTTLARRYAYGLFFLRPLRLETVQMEFEKGASARLKVRPAGRSGAPDASPADVERVAAWIRSGEEDYVEVEPGSVERGPSE